MRWKMFAAGAILLNAHISADAQECQPKDFTIQDLQKVDFSDSVKYSGYSLLDTSKNQEHLQGVNGSTVINGAPANLSWSDAQNVSQHMLETSGFNFNQDTKLNIVRTALSQAGVDMYHDCLGAQRIRAEVPKAAFHEPSFTLDVKWNPDPSNPSPGSKPIYISVHGGTVDGKSSLTEGTTIKKYDWAHYSINRTGEQSKQILQIAISIGPDKYPTLELPPLAPVRKYKFVQRQGVGKPPSRDHLICDHGVQMVSDWKSVATDAAKSCYLCISRSPDGILLRSTAWSTETLLRNAHADPGKNDNELEVCKHFWTGLSAGPGDRHAVNDAPLGPAQFYMWEAVPE
jgi:hypothetical protein